MILSPQSRFNCTCGPRPVRWQRKRFVQRHRGSRLLAERDPETGRVCFCHYHLLKILFCSDLGTFDEGAAQVRRLTSRDRKDYAGPDFEELLNNQFASDSMNEIVADEGMADENAKTATVDPGLSFSSASGKAVNPFDMSSSSPLSSKTDLFPAELESKEDVEPWWNFIYNITTTQIVRTIPNLLWHRHTPLVWSTGLGVQLHIDFGDDARYLCGCVEIWCHSL